MEHTVIKHTVLKEKEGTYYTIPFEVPEQTESFVLTYQYEKVSQGLTGKRADACIIDLGVMDCDGRFIGWSGSARNSITIGEFSSTSGYFCEPIKAGEWQIIIGAYKVNGEKVDVTYEIEFKEKSTKLYYGDLHVHSTASDGEFSVAQLAERAKAAGLDFLAVADHNNFCENFSLPRVAGLTFLPAVEWTHYKGHMNFFGVKAPFENSFIANTKQEMECLISQAKALGAVVSVNHPCCDICPYLWDNEEAYDMMEIWNGPMREVNRRAIEKWTELLKTGRKLPAVGGSDFHRKCSPVKLGQPVNGVYSSSASSEGLLEAIRSGHLFIASSKKAPALLLTCEGKMMGDTVITDKAFVTLTITAERLGGCSLSLVTKKGETTVGTGSTELDKECGFAYVKAVSKNGTVRAITNPIYFS
ncbi:MAG: CehA/McbA family metallohydrolase [Lachnospiraceae bacterium]